MAAAEQRDDCDAEAIGTDGQPETASVIHVSQTGRPEPSMTSRMVPARPVVASQNGPATEPREKDVHAVSLMTATPKPTEHLTVDVEDPRTLTKSQLSGNVEGKWR
jgi:hypothetical protein